MNFSSECAYGHQETDLVREDAPLHPTTPYGVTKVTTELLGDVYGSQCGLPVVSLRITQVYGPGNPMPEVLKEMIAAAVHDRPFRLEHGADHRFQFVHVHDVAAAADAAMAKGADGRRYNITGGRQVTLAKAAELVRTIIPNADIEIGPGHIPTLDRQGPYDITAAEHDLGYQPLWTLENGIRGYAAWLTDHPY